MPEGQARVRGFFKPCVTTCNSLLKSLLILITNFFLLETELDSLLRGELVRVLPMRQHRHSQVIITAPMTTQTTTNSLSSAAPTVRLQITKGMVAHLSPNVSLKIYINILRLSCAPFQ